jgi:SAM-dependent methyltransferase
MSASATRQAIEHWNKTPLFLAEEERYSVYPWLYEAAEFRHHRGERVLEIGCGTGADLLQFAKHGAIATGIDITSEHLKLARERVGNKAQVLYADATNIPLKTASFDYVYSHGVLHHIDKPRLVVDEIFRLLRPGGRFNIHVYAFWSYAHLNYRRIFGREWKLNVENSRDPVHLDLYTGRQLRKLFAPAKIRLEKYEYYRWQALGRWIGWFLVAKGVTNPPATRRPGDQ